MKTRILFLLVLLAIIFSTKAQISKCPELRISLDDSVYCWNTTFTLYTNSDSAYNRLNIWRRDIGDTTWRCVLGSSFGNNGILKASISQLNNVTPFPASTVPNFGSAVFDIVLSSNYSNNTSTTITPFSSNACFSNIIIGITIHPIPNIIVQPSTNTKTYCKNIGNRDTLWVRATGVGNILDTLLTYQWYRNTSNNNGVGTPITGETNRFLVPPSYQITGGMSSYYFCQISNQFGCSIKSNVSGKIFQFDTVISTVNLTLCDFQLPYFWNGQTLNAGGTYIRHFTSQYGCDSIAKLNLTVRTSLKKITTASICSNALPYYWDNRTYYNSTSDTVHRPNGVCDSLLILNLTVKPTSATTIYRTICDGAYVMVGTNKHFVTAVTTDILKNKLDCDSVVTLYLTVLPPTLYRDTTFKICPSAKATLNNKDYNKGGIYTDVIKNIAGCDSIVYHITIIELATSLYNQSVTVCRNTLPYFWNGTNYYNTGTYTKSFPSGNSVGCDSSAKLILVVKDTSAYTFTISICRDSSVTLWGTTYNTAGTYIKKLPNKAGCDSVITLVLTIKQPSASTTTAAICQTCSYTFNGTTYNTSGTYTHHLTNAVGCDSAATLVLTVGQITGDTVLCITDTAYYFIKNEQANNQYQWGVSGGAIYGSNTANPVKIKFDSTNNTYVTLTAKDSANHPLYSDTIWVKVGKMPFPRITTTGVTCQVFSDSLIGEHDTVYYVLDTASTGCTKVCEGGVYKYYVKKPTATSMYQWNINGGTPVNISDTTREIAWGSAGSGSITIIETTAMGCKDSVRYCFNILPSPKAQIRTNGHIVDTVEVCRGVLVSFYDNSPSSQVGGVIKNSWNFGDNYVPAAQNNNANTLTANHSYQTPGYYTVLLQVSNNCNCVGLDTVVVFVHDSTGVNIVCNKVVCDSTTAYYSLDVAVNANCTAAQMDSGWSVSGGHIVHHYGNAILVLWDSIGNGDTAYVYFDNSVCSNLCPAKSAIKIPVLKKRNMQIVGDSTICEAATKLYMLPNSVPGTIYTWTVSNNAQILFTSQPNEVYVKVVGNGKIDLHCDYYNSLAACGGKADLTITTLPKASILGNNQACQDDVVILTTNNTSGSWGWQIKNPVGHIDTVVVDTLRLVTSLSGSYELSIIGTGSCSSGVHSIIVNDKPLRVDTIQGIDTVCNTESYTYKVAHPQQGVVYHWGVSSGANFLGLSEGNEVSIQYNGIVTGVVKVWGINENGCVGDTTYLAITKLIPKTGFVDFDTLACPDSKHIYEVREHSADSYEWSIDPVTAGSIATGNGTDKATILWNHDFVGGYITVKCNIRKCGNNVPSSGIVYLQPAPQLSLTFDSSVCLNSPLTATISGTAGVTLSNILWSFGDGTTLTTSNASTQHTYSSPITTHTQYAISASVSNVGYLGCVYAAPILITSPANNSKITVLPTPKVTISPIGNVGVCHQLAHTLLTASTNSAYGNTDTLKWITPQGITSCTTPFTCVNYTATDTGSYYAVAVNAISGCSSKSDSVLVFPACIPFGCTTPYPSLQITGDTLVRCGITHLQLQCNAAYYYGTWYVGNETPTQTKTDLSYPFKNYGIYNITFSGAYGTSNTTANCYMFTTIKQIVPVVPKLDFTLSCNSSNTGYIATIGDYSGYLAGTSNVVYDVYVDGVLKQSGSSYEYIDAGISLGSSHSTYIVVHYTYNGVSDSCTTAVKTFTVPAIPDAAFTISPGTKHCEGLTLLFKPTSGFNAANSYYWRFGDRADNILYSPEKVYSFATIQNAIPSLQVSNGLGCVVTSSQSWTVAQNRLNGFLYEEGTNYVCPNANFSVNFNALSTTPTTYVWFDSRNPILRHYIDSGGIIYNPYPINHTGSYWVRVEDNEGCYKNINGNAVVIMASIDAPVISSNPAPMGSDTLSVCVNSAGFTLSTKDNLLGYTWNMNGVVAANNTGTNSISYDGGSLPVGLYAFTVTTLNDAGGGVQCYTTSKPFYVRVNAAPATPSIAITHVDCSNYSITLTANAATQGTYTWSTGTISGSNVYSSTTQVNQGGVYGVVLEAGLLCTSSASFTVLDNPKAYLNSLPKGCYNICLPDSGLTIPMPPSPSYTQWQWLMNTGTGYQNYTTGYHSTVPNLVIHNSGDYLLSLNNGLCTYTTAEPISILQPDTCQIKEQRCIFEVNEPDFSISWNSSCDTVIFSYVITNNNSSPVAYTITGGINLSGGIANTGTHTYSSIYTTAQNGVGFFGITFNFYYTVGNTTQVCSMDKSIEIDNCPYGRYASKTPAPLVTNNGLSIVPNPARNEIKVGVDKLIGSGELSITDYLGTVVKKQVFTGKYCSVHIESLPKGLYFVQVKDSKGVLSSGKLLVER